MPASTHNVAASWYRVPIPPRVLAKTPPPLTATTDTAERLAAQRKAWAIRDLLRALIESLQKRFRHEQTVVKGAPPTGILVESLQNLHQELKKSFSYGEAEGCYDRLSQHQLFAAKPIRLAMYQRGNILRRIGASLSEARNNHFTLDGPFVNRVLLDLTELIEIEDAEEKHLMGLCNNQGASSLRDNP